MMGIVLLSLLGVALTAFAIDAFGDDDDGAPARSGEPDGSDDTAPPEEPGDPNSIQVSYPDDPSGDVSIRGTDGDDRLDNLLFDDLDLDDRSLDVRAGRGSDLIAAGDRSGTFSGGVGADFLSAAGGAGQTLDGGFGEDDITATDVSGAQLFGGEGNDYLSIQHDPNGDENSVADGGNGFDFLAANISTPDGTGQSYSVLRGGEDGDGFDLLIRTNDDAYLEAVRSGTLTQTNAAGDPVVDAGVMARIADFGPGDDMNIDIRGADEGAGSLHDYRGFEVIERDGGTDLRLIWDGLRPDADGTYELNATVRFDGVTDLSDVGLYITALSPGMIGTEGDDVIALDSFLAPERVLAGDGNDSVTFSGAGPISLEGGAGNDTLTGLGDDVTLLGQGGDDALTGGHAAQMFGGAGDDSLTLNMTNGINDSGAVAYGGEGDDTITALGDVGLGYPDYSFGTLTGGAGADAFDVTLNLLPQEYGSTDPYDTRDARVPVAISDFTPGEDVLTIEIARGAGEEDREMTAAEIIRDDVGRATLVMSFAATSTSPALEGTMRLGDNPNITLDDIAFIQS
ncbi:calcium-binding protein [Roseovarius dicentrarchi]|uniref:calcium-binding protein n=1 Tax=Roseovarius dicentrarchi TaxID=2250573 RepID=UPI000DEB5969|nr:hypothetical protein [Roseovarius dicentrarchi]